MQTKFDSSTDSFRLFLKLRAELRNKIYCLAMNDIAVAYPYKYCDYVVPHRHRFLPGLARTNYHGLNSR